MRRNPIIAYNMLFLDFLTFSSSPAVAITKKAQIAIAIKPKAANSWRISTIGQKIFTQNSQPRALPTRSAEFVNIRVLHTEKAICIMNIPTEVHIMFHLHFLTLSSSLFEKSNRITPMMRNMAAIAIKKFLILNAIVVKASVIDADHGVKKKLDIGDTNSSKSSLLLPVSPTFTSRTLVSIGAEYAICREKNNAQKIIITRAIIGIKKVILSSISKRRKKCKHSRFSLLFKLVFLYFILCVFDFLEHHYFRQMCFKICSMLRISK